MSCGSSTQSRLGEQPRGDLERSEGHYLALPVGEILPGSQHEDVHRPHLEGGDVQEGQARTRPPRGRKKTVTLALSAESGNRAAVRRPRERTLWQLSNPVPEHTAVFKLNEIAKRTLHSVTLRDAVKLPAMVKKEEWLAAKTVGLYHEVTQLVSVMTDICTAQTCPQMCVGKNMMCKWQDEEQPTPVDLPAREYMCKVVGQAFRRLSDKTFIPHDTQTAFPVDFENEIKQMLKRFFRVYAHAYMHHIDDFKEFQAEAHLNHCFKHYYYFVSEFDLVDSIEMVPLIPLIDRFSEADCGDCEAPQ